MTDDNDQLWNRLNDLAMSKLRILLETNGNIMSEAHASALLRLITGLTDVASGKQSGRWAYPLPTGAGKTTAIVAWMSAVNELRLTAVSIAVAAYKVEALCNLKRALITYGIPEALLGIKHSKAYDPKIAKGIISGTPNDNFASEPTDDHMQSKQFALVTHQRTKGTTAVTDCYHYKGKPRSILIYDESFMVSQGDSINVETLTRGLGWYGALPTDPAATVSYVKETLAIINSLLASGDTNAILELPSRTPKELEDYSSTIDNSPANDALHILIAWAIEGLKLRIVGGDKGALVTFRRVLPDDIKNVVILDASYSVRSLVQLDSSVTNADSPRGTLARINSYKHVTIHQLYSGGGRTSLEKAFNKEPSDRIVTKEIAELINGISKDEAILIFTYKKRLKGIDFSRILMDDLRATGVDTHADIEDKRRIRVLTWGHETSLNDYAHCKHVILVGVMQRDDLDMISSYLGQRNDINAEVTPDILARLKHTEVCHLVYQAISRGACRVVNNGIANEMHAYVIHRQSLEGDLRQLMPELQYVQWKPKYMTSNRTAVLAKLIGDYLRQNVTTRISTMKLKEALNLKTEPPTNFTTALGLALEEDHEFILRERSVWSSSYYIQQLASPFTNEEPEEAEVTLIAKV